ncbi:alpha/beta fold hydrolase [Sporichthya polymorpha]|uniref:alpha/beta fold hydrolase n=1 Tax=Sporichthya polymorpha TaxID=35751 RepID=UPI000360929E|nr:alpha/beta fold hydrolase [Sporichthya polymorpha]
MNPERLRVSANGLAFEVLAWGRPDDPLVLCLHGFPDTPWTWRELGPYLAARGRRVVAPFLRGYAPTDLAPDDDYSAPAIAQDVLALHAALGGDTRAALVGHDWGAVVTYAVTQAAPATFARYVTLAVPPTAAVIAPFRRRATLTTGLGQLRRSWYTAFNQLPGISERSLDRLIPKLWRDWSPGFAGRGDAETALTALQRPENRRAALRYYRDNLRPGAIRTGIAPLGAPLLYLHGADDGCMRVELLPLAEPHLPPGSRAVAVDDAGHFLQLEKPAVVNGLIGRWIAERDPNGQR